MTEQRIRREAVSDQLFTLLRDRILSGALAAGTALTAERDLATEFGVNRHAVREAVKRLQQARLVEVSHGERTTVLDWRRTAGLDLALELAHTEQLSTSYDLRRDVLEMRASIGADAARLCAARCPDQSVAEIVSAAAAYINRGPDLADLAVADVDWWRLIVEGSGNIAYLLAFNSLVGDGFTAGEVPTELRATELLDVAGHMKLAALIASRDEQGAEAAARALLARSLPAAHHTREPEGGTT
ncbi:FadR/GntR family transcriptional regulator [Streptomyces sp. NPDC098781]|uniref:FadR/GntR family transcriptional regulator n=1 Tax=Streptomyces sp. NPDC098781 TaxID=3366097 RepID=UPI003803406D